jgi:AraC-like DNA-binding protein
MKTVQHAKSLLVSGNYSVKEAAEICGFDNLSYFSQTYKKYMNVSPGEHKKHFSGSE